MLAATQGLTEAVTSALGAVTDEGREEMPPPPVVGGDGGSPLPPPLPLPPSPLPPTPPLPSSLPPPRSSIDLPSPPLSVSQVRCTKVKRNEVNHKMQEKQTPPRPAPPSAIIAEENERLGTLERRVETQYKKYPK